MNTKDIADALAARFTGVTATKGTITEGLVLGPTAELPNTINRGPALVVLPPTGELAITLRRRADTLTFRVLFLRDPLNVPERTQWMYAWYDALRDKVEEQMTLGLSYVAWAEVTGMEMELDGYTYAGTLYDRVELTVTVRLDETISTLAP